MAFMLRLNIGSDPFTVFTQGIAKTCNMSAGNANRLITVCLGLILLVLDRTYIKLGTILSILLAGSMMDLMYMIYGVISFDRYSIVVKSVLFLVCLIPISFGIPMIKLAQVGVAPNDSVYFVLEDHLKQPYSRVRMGSDAIYFVLGILCGGTIGIGTLLCLACLGPMTSVTFPKVERFAQRFLVEERFKEEKNKNG